MGREASRPRNDMRVRFPPAAGPPQKAVLLGLPAFVVAAPTWGGRSMRISPGCFRLALRRPVFEGKRSVGPELPAGGRSSRARAWSDATLSN